MKKSLAAFNFINTIIGGKLNQWPKQETIEQSHNLKSRLLGGGARPNLFEVELTNLPASVTFPWQAERFGFLCKAAQMPAMTIANIDVPFRGRSF